MTNVTSNKSKTDFIPAVRAIQAIWTHKDAVNTSAPVASSVAVMPAINAPRTRKDYYCADRATD